MPERVGDLEDCPEENPAPQVGSSCSTERPATVAPGGFPYREEPGSDEEGGFFCGYLTDEVWHHRRTDDG